MLAHAGPSLDLTILPAILTGLDYSSILKAVKEKRGEREPEIERVWKVLKVGAPLYLQRLMVALDNLEKDFLARKKLYHREEADGPTPIVHWFLADSVMQRLGNSTSGDADVTAVEKLISARYLVADNTNQPWDFTWDD